MSSSSSLRNPAHPRKRAYGSPRLPAYDEVGAAPGPDFPCRHRCRVFFVVEPDGCEAEIRILEALPELFRDILQHLPGSLSEPTSRAMR